MPAQLLARSRNHVLKAQQHRCRLRVGGAREQGMSPTGACRQLIARAALEWRRHEGEYRDDITATVLWLPDVVRELTSGAPAAAAVAEAA